MRHICGMISPSMRQPSLRLPVLLIFCAACHSASNPIAGAAAPAPAAAPPAAKIYSGLIAPTDAEYRAVDATKMVRTFATPDVPSFATLPARVDLAAQLPQARDQGTQNSCTAWAAAFAVKSFQENREHGWGLDDAHLFSPAFVYNQVSGGHNNGAKLLDVLQFVTDHGTVPLPLMPYNEHDMRTQPSAALKAKALEFRGLGYRRVDFADLRQLKAYLAAGEPVILVVEMFPGMLPQGMAKTQNVYGNAGGASLGHHAVVAVGYDDARSAIKVLNSWGPGWGDRGYGWITESFAPQVIKQAFVLYDLPSTPPTAAAHVLIVPEESGVTMNKQWLRLGEPMPRATEYFPEPMRAAHNTPAPGFAAEAAIDVQPDIRGNQTIRRLRFVATPTVTVATNQGVTFGTPRAEVHRIYGAPDHTDAAPFTDLYFFQAATEDWGGLPITTHASLQFTYDTAQRVSHLTLESVFKAARTGKGFTAVAANEQAAATDGTRINLADRGIAFTVPKEFSDIKKSVWENLGVGFFCTDPNDPMSMIVVKIFDNAAPVTDDVLRTRIAADLKANQLADRTTTPTQVAGLAAQRLATDTHHYYYLGTGKQIVQLQFIAESAVAHKPWTDAFLSSVSIQH